MERRAVAGYVLMTVVVTLFLLSAVALWIARNSSLAVSQGAAVKQSAVANYLAEAGLHHASWQANNSNCENYSDLNNLPLGNAGSYSASFSASSGSPVTITASAQLADGSAASLQRSRQVFGAPVTVPFGNIADNYLDDGAPSGNNGSELEVRLANKTNSQKRALMKFDLSTIPAGSTIQSAQLVLNLEGIGSGAATSVAVHHATVDWSEDQSNWTAATLTSNWGTPGGDYSSQVWAQVAVDPLLLGSTSWDLTALIKQWFNGELSNHGIALVAAEGANNVDFTARESPLSANRPKLEISYSCECGLQCVPATSCDADYLATRVNYNFDMQTHGIDKATGVGFIPAGRSFDGEPVPAEGGLLAVDENDDKLRLFSMSGALLRDKALSSINSPTGVSWVGGGQWLDHIAVVDSLNRRLYVYDLNGILQTSHSTVGLLGPPEAVTYIGDTESGLYEQHWAVASASNGLGFGNATLVILSQNMVPAATLDLSAFASRPYGLAHIPNSDKLLVVEEAGGKVFIVNFAGQLLREYDTAVLGIGTPRGIAVNLNDCQHVVVDMTSNDSFFLEEEQVTACLGDYVDTFEQKIFNGSYGTVDWSPTPWVELGESDGPTSGNVEITKDKGVRQLKIAGASRGVMRQADLSGGQQAMLSYRYRRSSLDDAADYVAVEISASGSGGPWTELARFAGPANDNNYDVVNHDITAFISADTTVRLISSAGLGETDVVWFGDLTLQRCTAP